MAPHHPGEMTPQEPIDVTIEHSGLIGLIRLWYTIQMDRWLGNHPWPIKATGTREKR
jgi:hypothetical protein